MKFLNHLWPWKEISRLNGEIDFLKRTLEHEQSSHNLTRASLQDHKLELIDHRSRVEQGKKDIRKLATILAMKGGITILLLFLSLSAFGQQIQRQLFTTNTLPILSSISGPMVTTNGSGQPELTFNGAGLTNITGVAVAQGTNIITRTNGQVVTVNGVTDTNVVNILLGGVTNGAILNLSNYVSTISQNATNESLLIGLGATNQATVVSNGVFTALNGHGSQTMGSGVNAQAIASGASTNFYYMQGSAGGASTFNTYPCGIDGNIIEFRVFYAGTILSTTNITFDIYTNDFTGNVAAKATSFQAIVASGTHFNAATNSIPIKAGYGFVVAVSQSAGTGMAASSYTWSARVSW